MKVAIIIPVFNNLKYTKTCLQSFTQLVYEINGKKVEYIPIVIDDGSSDGTEDWVQANYPNVPLLKGDGNLWWSGGVNVGVEYALTSLNCTHVLLWNNDIVSADNYFHELSKLIISVADDIIIGSKISDTAVPPNIWSMGGMYNTKNGDKFMYGLDRPVPEITEGYLSVDWLPGMGTLVPRKVVEKIGYWNAKDFPQYHGDSDYTFRAKQAGFKLFVYPQIEIFNDTENTGLMHGGNFKGLKDSLTSVRSQYNWKIDNKFYSLYAHSFAGYWHLYIKYFKYIGGFFKWQLLRMIGVEKN